MLKNLLLLFSYLQSFPHVMHLFNFLFICHLFAYFILFCFISQGTEEAYQVAYNKFLENFLKIINKTNCKSFPAEEWWESMKKCEKAIQQAPLIKNMLSQLNTASIKKMI